MGEVMKTLDKFPTASILFSLIRNIAKQEQIDLNELENIVGSGKDGRLNKQDVLDYLSSRKPESNPIINGIKESSSNVMAMNQSGQDEIIVMDRMRKNNCFPND